MIDPKDITFGVTHFLRPRALNRCLRSIRKYFPDSPYLHQDTGGNVSMARNKLVLATQTPYYFLLEEDMRFTSSNISVLVKALLSDDELMGASGGVYEPAPRKHTYPKRYAVATNYVRKGKVIWCEDSRDFQKNWIKCDCTLNLGLFHTDRLARVLWNPQLELAEHYEFFYRAAKRQGYRMACTTYCINHERVVEGDYQTWRGRSAQFRAAERRSIGGVFKRIGPHVSSYWDTLSESARLKRGMASIVRKHQRQLYERRNPG